MKQDLYRAVYCSRISIHGPPRRIADELRTILKVSRRNNARDDLSGALLFANQCFAQALEGPRAALERCFERIQNDPRHADVTVLEFGPTATREFPKWSMAFAGDPSPEANDPLAFVVFEGAFARAREQAGSAVLGLLHGLVRREEAWALA
jgi:hypothetical protein